MCKTFISLVMLSLVCLLGALEFTLDGEARTRAVMYYADEHDEAGSHIDSKLWLGTNLSVNPDLNLRLNLQFGDVVWGSTTGGQAGGGISAGIPVTAYELYVDYRIQAIRSNVRVGQQYWADHRSLMLDDSFSGVTFSSDDVLGLQTTLGWIKQVEGDRHLAGDDVNSFLLSARGKVWGLQAFYTMNEADSAGASTDIITALPYLVWDLKPLNIDLTGILQHSISPTANDLDYGAAARISAELKPVELGLDALWYANEDPQINYALSQYYMNKLYIFGVGQHFDGWVGWDQVNWYWGQTDAPDMYLGTVGFANVALAKNLGLFAAGGPVLKTGWEANAGLELDLGNFQLAAYGAYGQHQGAARPSYLIGSTLKASFY